MNWHERIEEARQRGGSNDEDAKLAGSWVTCACGLQDPRIPRYGVEGGALEGAPIDSLLYEFGRQFYLAIEADSFDRAEELLIAIEQRAGEVLAEQGV